MRVLTVVPARSGSKGLPGKNILEINGKPLIAWSIEAGLASKFVDEIILSTDSLEIAEIGKKFGAKIPFLRPSELAQDKTSTSDVLLHLISELEKQGQYYTHLLLLEPTSPLRTAEDIDTAFELLIKNTEAESIVGVSVVESQHPSFCVSVDNEGFIHSASNYKVLRRQEIDELYFYEGSVYITRIDSYKLHKSFYHNKALALKMPKWKSYEIDDLTDYIIVESLMKNKNKLSM
jgi:CMP-N,N'-diacetyllegionaminic acid synthase